MYFSLDYPLAGVRTPFSLLRHQTTTTKSPRPIFLYTVVTASFVSLGPEESVKNTQSGNWVGGGGDPEEKGKGSAGSGKREKLEKLQDVA